LLANLAGARRPCEGHVRTGSGPRTLAKNPEIAFCNGFWLPRLVVESSVGNKNFSRFLLGNYLWS
jgi:hypothetical protein